MKPGQDRHVNALQARSAYERGENVTALLRRQLGVDVNTPEVIELAYDIQSGSYISKADGNPNLMRRYCDELAVQIDPFTRRADSILDVGTGEMTILSGVLASLNDIPSHVYALDISWSRLHVGKRYANRELGHRVCKVTPLWAKSARSPCRTNQCK